MGIGMDGLYKYNNGGHITVLVLALFILDNIPAYETRVLTK
jgi:hypothetical protein